MAYCCKKCQNGKVTKFSSDQPCLQIGAVDCLAPDPECKQEILGTQKPIAPELQTQGPGKGEAPPCTGGYKQKSGQLCKPRYKEQLDKDGVTWCCPIPKEGCKDGYKPGTVNGQPLAKCRKGYEFKKFNDQWWCCPGGGAVCTGDEGCNAGEICVDGKCVKNESICCQNKKCTKMGYRFGKTNPKLKAACNGKKEGEDCDETIPPPGVCPEGITPGDAYGGCACGKKYVPPVAGTCTTGYVWVGKKSNCQCIKYCGDIGYEADCVTKTEVKGEEFKWSDELQAMFDKLMERMNYLLEYPLGYTPEEKQAIINYATEGIKRTERGRLESAEQKSARMGLLDSRLVQPEEDEIRRATQEAIASVQSGVAIDEVAKRFQELTGTTGMAQSLAQALAMMEQVPESLSAARRSEGRDSMSMLLSFFSNLLGTNTQMSSSYIQAILSQLMSSSGTSSGSSSWLPWLIYLLGSGGLGGLG
jgi:hypothetical protein